MIIGCTGNYRKEEYFIILERIYSILSKSDTELLISDDLLKYGFIPELIGRLPVLSPLEELTENTMKTILLKPKNSLLKQYEKLFES